MSYTPKQWRAINWLIERDKLVPQISAWPLVRLAQKDGPVIEEHIHIIVDWYDNHRAQVKREERARAKAERTAQRAKS